MAGLSSELRVGLKEWASVCSALESGRQILLLRKGGIHEAAGEFELEHPQFLLFPTYLHQNKAMLKPEAQGGLATVSAEPQRITLRCAGAVTDILRLDHRSEMDALDSLHIWTSPLIDMRFNYRPENPLYLVLVRTYRLADPVTIENTPAYAGCRSWVPLERTVGLADARPALEDADYDLARREVLHRLQRGA